MPKPRTPANVLELRGAFRKDPQRRRTDARGVDPFNTEPPVTLPQEAVAAWHELVTRLPTAQWFSCDEHTLEVCAALLAKFRTSADLKVATELRAWLGKAGLTPTDRLKLTPAAPESTANPFAKFRRKVEQAARLRSVSASMRSRNLPIRP